RSAPHETGPTQIYVGSAAICVPPQGSGYTAFTLTDGTARVPVIAWGTQQIGMGDVVEVRDAFRTRLERGERGAPRHRRGEVRAHHIPVSPGRDSSDGGARHGVARTPLVQECARSGSRVQVRTGNPLLPKGRDRCGNCCVAASCTVIRLSRSPSKQTASCVTR